MAASTRASRKQQTQKKFLEAIDRLLKGEAKCKSLKTMKLNNSNVEKEAGEKGNTIRHYPRVLDFISAKKKDPQTQWTEEGDFIGGSGEKVVPRDVRAEELKLRLDEKFSIADTAEENASLYKGQCDALTAAMKTQLEAHEPFVAALFSAIPHEQKLIKLKQYEDNLLKGDFGNFNRPSLKSIK
ncbi:hypothetical protein FA893_07785 [Photobacterium damselae subsp. piscicida]|uniref:hypothetical protein n=1 Tax=Photobacterium damselae TaxID=38293 RepID=UPI0002E4CFC4|nr:hypothetical protein [Photobacterium damselae]OLQ80139.1 hypothetical protein BEI67_14525 [Photobacterium damselae subsp. piscicida]TFZ58294.1 hypothetical protein E4T25_10445 [Photobacterium damselae subsp. piscicida]TJZ93597.1 hypothetical protein FA893_07785 [Photobacterium damselae subsp. piscicida]BBC40956.1 hypothetical protein PDPE_1-01796 [Photobacterium damselae subsp. piscicida]